MLALLGLAVAGLALHVAWVSGFAGDELTELINHWVYNGVLVLAAVVCVLRAVASPEQRPIWLAFGLGVGLWAGADIYWSAALAGVKNAPYPSLADVGYLLVYPSLCVGVVLMVRRRSRLTASTWLDSAIVGVACVALGTALLTPTLVGLTNGALLDAATSLSYPLGDTLLLAFLIVGIAATGLRPGRTWLLVGAGIAVWGAADGIYLYQEALGTYDGGYLDCLWLAGGILIAAAATFSVRDNAPVHEASLSILIPVLFGCVAIGVLASDHFARLTALSVWLSVVTLAGVMLRLVLTYRANVALLTVVRREAVTDALTGLGNRRALLTDLEHAVRGPDQTVLAIFDLNGFKAYNDGFGHPAGDALLQRIGEKLRGAMTDGGRAYRLGGDEFCVLVPGGHERVGPLLAEADEVLHERGEGFLVTASAGAAVVPAEANLVSTALHLADTRMYHAKGRRQVSVQRQAHDVLTRLLREREPALSAHQTGVTRLAVEVGRQLGLGAEQLDLLTRAAELHDIGKIAIPDKVLHKRGPLDESDWELMRTHTITGQRILAAAPALEPVAELVRSSHERWDGDGYPDGLESSAIPLGARIIFVCDAYEAMTEQRSYRRPRTPEQAVEELRRCAGTQFDPKIVEVLVERVLPLFAVVERPLNAWRATGAGFR